MSHTVDAEEMAATIAGQRNAVDAKLVRFVAQLIDTEVWHGSGIRSVGHWLTIHIGCSSAHAHRIAKIAARRHELPALFEAFDAGRLSLDVVEVATQLGPAWADPQLIDLAEYATVGQLRTELHAIAPLGADTPEPGGAVAAIDDDTATDGGDRHESDPRISEPTRPEHFSYGWGDDGRFRGSFDLDADHGLILEAALDERRDALFHAGVRDATAADAIGEIAARSIEAAGSARRRRHTCMVHIDIGGDRLASRLSNGVALPSSLTEYLTCDSDLRPIWFDDHTPLGAGTDQRAVPINLRRIIEQRDQGCRLPGCGHRKHLDIHHIVHWGNGGPTESWNLVSLCRTHHRMHHQGRLRISGNPDGLRFADEHGAPLRTGPRPRPPDELPEPLDAYVHPSGERLDVSAVNEFMPPDRYRRYQQALDDYRSRSSRAA